MDKTKYSLKDLGEMKLKDVLAVWKEARRELFRSLSKDGMRYEQIGEKYGVSRQEVGRIVGPKSEWEKVK